MVLDSSAIVAILLAEPEAEAAPRWPGCTTG